MGNPWAGEVTIVIDGQERVLKLTLGALAELEQALESGSLVDLVERFEGGRFSGRDLLALIGAGLKGGGSAVEPEVLASAEFEGGPLQAARCGAELLARTFMLPGET